MPLRFLLDEHLRGRLWHALERHNRTGGAPIDAIRVGDLPDLPLGTLDPDILLWAEHNNRILLTLDIHTMPQYLAAHLTAGHQSPGVFVIRGGHSLGQVVTSLELVAHADDAADYLNQVVFIP